MRHWFRRWLGRSRRVPQQRLRRRRPYVEYLEDRCLLAAPVLDPIQVPLNIPANKELVVPISGTDPAGGNVTYTITSSNPNVQVTPVSGTSTNQPLTGNTFLQMTVQGFGTMEFELFNDLTPQTAAIIGGMAKNEFYNGLTFHRILANFVIQGGDPAGNGTGGPGFTFNDEFNPQLIYSGTGQLAMANSGFDTNGSQFFVTVGPQRGLDFNNAIFGQLIRGFNVLQAINSVPTDSSGKPNTPVVISNAQIVQDTTDAVFLLKSTGTSADTTTLTITATASTGGTTTTTATANVVADSTNDPPTLGPITDQVQPVAGASDTFTLTRTDLEDDASTFEANLVNSSDANNVTVTLTPAADNKSAQVTVTPKTVNGAPFTGKVALLVGVEEQGATSRGNDTTTGTFFDTQNIAVSFGDQPLTLTPATSVAATEGTSAAGVTLGTLIDADTTSAAGDFSVSVNWGDGSPLDTSSGQLAAVAGSPGHFTVTGTHTYKEAGTFPILVKINDTHTSTTAGGDNGGATANGSSTATVADAPVSRTQVAPITATAGTPLNNAVLATFTDSDPNAKAADYTATINWGDGTGTTPGTVQNGTGAGQFQVTGSHTYANPGTFTPSVSFTDVNSAGDATPATANATTTAVVSPAVAGPTPPPTAGPTLSANQQYVERLFLDLLGQSPTTDQLNTLSGQLDQGTSRASVVQQIQALPAYKPHLVELAYQGLVGKGPTTKQLDDAVKFLDHGGQIGTLRVRLYASQDFFQVRGHGTDAGYLSALSQIALQQALDAATRRQLTQELAGGASRLTVVKDLVKSHLQQVRQAEVRDLYQEFLHRVPTAAEVSSQVSKLSGGDEEAVIVALLTSTEYFNDAQQQQATGTTLSSSANPAVSGQSVTFTAIVAPTNSGASATPTGTVTFFDGGNTLGTGALDPTGKAVFTTSGLASGAHSIAASYGGDAHFAPSSSTLTENVL